MISLRTIQAAVVVLELANRSTGTGLRMATLVERQARVEPSEAAIAHARLLLTAAWSLSDERERRIVTMLSQTDRGEPRYTQRDVARDLGISPATVNRYLARALRQIEAKRAAALADLGTACDFAIEELLAA